MFFGRGEKYPQCHKNCNDIYYRNDMQSEAKGGEVIIEPEQQKVNAKQYPARFLIPLTPPV
jgi:hypothetical protein